MSKQKQLAHTSLVVAEGPAQGAAQAHLPVLQVLQQQLAHGDGLPVQLVAQLLVVGHGPSDHQHLLKQEHVQLLFRESRVIQLFLS